MSRDDRKSACPPSWDAPDLERDAGAGRRLREDHRERLPGQRSLAVLPRLHAARRGRISPSRSSRPRSGMARKSRLVIRGCSAAGRRRQGSRQRRSLTTSLGDDDALPAQLGQLEQHVLQQRRHHGVQPARADVLHPLVRHRAPCAPSRRSPSVRELELRALGGHQRRVLLGQRVLRLGHDADEVRLGERLELDADREAALQLGDQVARLGDVERAGGDEEDVVGPHLAVAGLHGRALDDRQQVALHALARDVRARRSPARRRSCRSRRGR